MDKQYITIDCLTAQQPIGNMYVAVIDSQLLSDISYADVRRLEKGNEDRAVESYIGIQRPLVPAREKEISEYVKLVDATFPNSIILSMSSEDAEYLPHTKQLRIINKPDVAKVLDGQHRIAGLRNFEGTFQCIVTIYIDMDLEDQAIVFATINKEQKGVSKSLVADLYEFAKTRSPQKTCHNIARALNDIDGSPFYHKIKILGVANSVEETITQDAFVKNLVKYISKSPQKDRDILRRNEKTFFVKEDLEYDESMDRGILFLRRFFIGDKDDVVISQIILNYFRAVQTKWPNAWNEVKEDMILNKSTGFIALMRLFRPVYLAFSTDIPSVEQFLSALEPISLKDQDFNKNNYVPGTSGQAKLYHDMLEQAGLKD